LKNNRIPASFPDAYIKRNDYSKRLMFNQSETADFDFIARILFNYGLSFTSIHPAVSEDSTGTAELVFSDGNSFPAPVLEYSDGREVPQTTLFDFIQPDEAQNIWKMDSFHIENTIGVNGLRLSAVYPEFNYGNEDWKTGEIGGDKRCVTYNRLFTGYERGTPKDEIDADVQQVISARFRSLELAKTRWTGTAANISLMPGCIFELVHFTGVKNEDTITALVTSAKTHVRAVWPEYLAVKPEAGQIGELTELEFTCMNYAAGVERRFCGNLSQ
jgi:uncharacterized protein involved in type VI secretion and phage assembly